MPFPNCHIYQPPNAHVRILGILLSNAMAVVAVKKIWPTHAVIKPRFNVMWGLLDDIYHITVSVKCHQPENGF
jgi:hypothetical protein